MYIYINIFILWIWNRRKEQYIYYFKLQYFYKNETFRDFNQWNLYEMLIWILIII